MTRRLLVPIALLAAAAVGPAAPPPAPSDAEFAALLKTIRPAAGEDVFATIPWQTSLWAAREKAAKEGKPILLWEMDGHPLGCG
ncbi:MAG: hypothetical protein U0871_25505 [Gemmataceae bacterium]